MAHPKRVIKRRSILVRPGPIQLALIDGVRGSVTRQEDWLGDDAPFWRSPLGADEGAAIPQRFMTIMDDEPGPEWTGLYDSEGRKLMRPRQPFGFRR